MHKLREYVHRLAPLFIRSVGTERWLAIPAGTNALNEKCLHEKCGLF